MPTLDKMIANRRWLRCSDPFPYYYAEDVFTSVMVQAFEENFREIVSLGFSEASGATHQFSRNMRNFDAYSLTFWSGFPGPFSVFLSRDWHDMMADLAGVDATGDVNGGLHHHRVGSDNGTLHNDFNPGWFVDGPSADGVNVSNGSLCDYHTGDINPSCGSLVARETVRAAVMIYYLNNPPYVPGDGGETGLYRGPRDAIDKPVETIPPINNSLFLMECTPHTYHSFLANRRHPRNSVILWIHCSKADAIQRWGEDKIVYWR